MASPSDEPQVSMSPQDPEVSAVGTSGPTDKPKALAIEYPTSSPEKQVEEEIIHTLDVGEGNVVKLDRLGPIIVNSDGTLSRIQNWHELGEIERERTVRLLVKKRNVVRLGKMDEQERASGREAGEKMSALRTAEDSPDLT